MKIARLSVLTVAGLAVLVAGFAADAPPPPRAVAEYLAPEKFSDFRDGLFDSEKGREQLIAAFNAHLATLGERYVPAGQRLELRFRDIDLAGDFEPWRGPSFDDIRIVKDIYSPRMEFDYRLVDALTGAVIREGAEKLSDLGFLMASTLLPSHDQLRYDKEILTDWVRAQFRRAAK